MRFSKLIKCYRQKYDIGLRELSKEIGISAATLSRIENVKFLPDLITFNKILNWLLEAQKG